MDVSDPIGTYGCFLSIIAFICFESVKIKTFFISKILKRQINLNSILSEYSSEYGEWVKIVFSQSGIIITRSPENMCLALSW